MKNRNGFVSNSSSSSFVIMSRLKCRKVKREIIKTVKDLYHPDYISMIKKWKNISLENKKFQHELTIAVQKKVIYLSLQIYKNGKFLTENRYNWKTEGYIKLDLDDSLIIIPEIIKHINKLKRRKFKTLHEIESYIYEDKVLDILIDYNVKKLIYEWGRVYNTIFCVEYASDNGYLNRNMRCNIMPYIIEQYSDPYSYHCIEEDKLRKKYKKRGKPFPYCIKFYDDKS